MTRTRVLIATIAAVLVAQQRSIVREEVELGAPIA
jgi:hypothetical protein